MNAFLCEHPVVLMVLIILVFGVGSIGGIIAVILDVRNSRKRGRELDEKAKERKRSRKK